MKTFKKQIVAGAGRAIGMIFVYAILALTIKMIGLKIDFSTLPPTLSGEITRTLQK